MSIDDWHWATKEGVVLHIRDMKTEHIENCLRIIKNNNFGYTAYFGCDGYYDKKYVSLRGKYENMVNELRLRKLEGK